MINKIKDYLEKKRKERKRRKIIKKIRKFLKKALSRKNIIRFVVFLITLAMIASFTLPYILS